LRGVISDRLQKRRLLIVWGEILAGILVLFRLFRLEKKYRFLGRINPLSGPIWQL